MKMLFIAAVSVMLAFGQSEMAVAAKKQTYTISITAGPNGKVMPKKTQIKVKEGKSKSLIIKPKKKYMIDALIVNGIYRDGIPTKLGKPYVLKLKKVAQDTTITVSFDTKRNPPPAAEGLAVGSQVSVVDPK